MKVKDDKIHIEKFGTCSLKSLSVIDRDFYFFCLKGSRYRKIFKKTCREIFQREYKKKNNFHIFFYILKGRLTNPAHLPPYFLPYVRKYYRSCQSSLILDFLSKKDIFWKNPKIK